MHDEVREAFSDMQRKVSIRHYSATSSHISSSSLLCFVPFIKVKSAFGSVHYMNHYVHFDQL